MAFLEDDDTTLEDAHVADLSQVLLEVRNKDLTWPEEMSQITTSRNSSNLSTRSQNKKG